MLRKLVLVGLAASLLVACRHPASKIEGHWQGQKVDGIAPTAQLSGDAFAQGTEIIAQGNQIAIQTPAGRNPAATFIVDKEDPTTLVLHTDRDNSTETFTFNEKADVMIWKVDAQRSITFRKMADSK